MSGTEEPEWAYRVTIPLRGGDEVLTVSPSEDAYLTVLIALLERLSDLHNVVIVVERIEDGAALHAPIVGGIGYDAREVW